MLATIQKPCKGVVSENCNIAYTFHYIEECWKNRQYYKNEQNKLLYWIGGLFVAMIGASGIMGAIKASGVILSFTYWHTLLFHILFVIVWYYYLYKQLNADMYEKIGLKAEQSLLKAFDLKPYDQIPSICDIKGHYLGKYSPVTCGRSLTRIANVLIVCLYIVAVTAPIWEGGVTRTTVSIGWAPASTILVFSACIIIGEILFRYSRKKVFEQISLDWQGFSDKLLEGGVSDDQAKMDTAPRKAPKVP